MRLLSISILFFAFSLVSCEKNESAPAAENVSVHVKAKAPISAELASQFSGEKAFAHLEKLTELGPRPSESAGYEAALAYLEKELHRLGWQTTRQKFKAATPIGPTNFTNLLARFAPENAPDWSRSVPFVIGSHLDSKRYSSIHFLGVNDSGSSSAALVELARVLATEPTSASQVELVFFDGEEAMLQNITPRDGLYGSKEYARQLRTRRDQPHSGLVLDLIGDPKIPFLISPDSSKKLYEIALKSVAAAKLESRFEKPRGMIIDDHIPLQQIGGLDTLLIIGDFQKMTYWHTKNDTLENVSPKALQEAGKVALGILHELSK